MHPELVGRSRMASGPGGRSRPAGAGPFALLAFAVALLPIGPGLLWVSIVAAAAAAPWALGALRPRHPAPHWRLSATGLEQTAPNGDVISSYERDRIEEFALTSDDGVLTVFHKFGRTPVGELAHLGFEPLPFYITVRRLGMRIRVLDGDAVRLTEEAAEQAPSPDHTAEQRLLAQEAELLAAAHDPEQPPEAPPEPQPLHLNSPPLVPGRRRFALLGGLVAAVSFAMAARIALGHPSHTPGFGTRLAVASWTLAGLVVLLAVRRRLLAADPVHWTITPDHVRVTSRSSTQTLNAADTAALVTGPGVRIDPLSGEPRPSPLTVLAFDHRLRLLARLPAHDLDAFQLTHGLHEHGYRVVTPGAAAGRPSDYGLDGLPEIFSQVPGGRLVVADDGLGWADAAGDVVLRMPEDRIGGIELLTIGGHAWLRLYDSDGDEFFAAPLSALRISRTDLRESAKRAGLPVTDAEYDAYLSAAFHGTVGALTTTHTQDPPSDKPTEHPGILLDATRRSRAGTYALSIVLCEVVALLGARWLGGSLGGFALTLAWSAPTGLLIGLAGYWLYDRNREQLRVSPTGIAVVSRRGHVAWTLARGNVGGVGIDDSVERLPRLVVWSPAGRVLRQVSFPPDLSELRRACERFGLPWGPPDADRLTPPPPEL